MKPAIRQLAHGLIVAALFLGASVALRWLTPEYLSLELGRRLLGFVMGAVIVAYANAAPKTLTPLIQRRCDPATEQAIRRFTGWTLALGGAAYALTWLIAPLDSAEWLSMGLLGFALLLVIGRVVLKMMKGKSV
jgi:Ca2+/Na+ antiporter